MRTAVIVAGGAGTRLRSTAPGVAKVLVDVGGEPLLARHLRLLARHGVETVYLTVGHLREQIEAWCASRPDAAPRCVLVPEDRPLGTAGGLAALTDRLCEPFVLLYGDVLAEIDVRRLARFHREARAAATLVAHPNGHPHDSDLLDADENGRIRRLLPAAGRAPGDYRNLVSAAAYALEPSILRHLVPHRPQDFVRDLFPAALSCGEPLFAYRTPEYLKDLGTPERLAAVREDVAAGRPEACAWRARRPAAFLDRDGTLNRRRGEIVDPDALELLPGAARAVSALNRAGILAVLVSNQPMLAKGRLTFEGLERLHARLETLLGRAGAYLDAIHVCPHHPDRGFPGEVAELKGACRCRKPEPGMIERAIAELPVDAVRSFVVGDSWRDTLAARAAGLRSIGVRTGDGFDGPHGAAAPDELVQDVEHAARRIVELSGASREALVASVRGEER